MTRRMVLPAAAAIALAACASPDGTTVPVTYDQKVKRIEALTQALSLGKNEELQKSLQGLQTVGQTLSQGAFKQTTAAASGMVAAGSSNVIAAGGGALSPGRMGYALRALVADLDRAVSHDAYALAATAEQDGATVTYDDATGELQAVKAPDAEATFKLVTAGDARTWTMDLTKSKDGTVGTLLIELAAGSWVDQPAAGGDEAPFKIFGGQQPDFNTVSRVRFKADFKAQGQESLRMAVEAVLDEWAPVQGARVPARFGLNLDVATLGVQTDTRVGWSTLELTSQGGLQVRTSEAPKETFTYDLAVAPKANTGTLNLVSQSARMRFGVEARPGNVTSGLYDSDNGQKLADVAQAAGKPGTIEIRFTDGRVVAWDPAAGQTLTSAAGSR